MKLFVRQLTVMDFSYLHPVRGLVGESWYLDVELSGGLDEQGMVLDFGEVKRTVKQLVDEAFDHRLLAPADHPALSLGNGTLRFELAHGGRIVHRGPEEAVRLIAHHEVTPRSVADAIATLLRTRLPANVHRLKLHLHPEPEEGAFYHYSHGLKGHCGNCQRIAHGHRSRIEILRDGRRAPDLEARWAERLRDGYIGTQGDLDAITRHGDRTHFRFAYQAGQGRFELELPAERCYLIDAESTVENIARHIRLRLEHEHPGARFQVRAFEGIGKGAVSETP